jgi:hypothetical protein
MWRAVAASLRSFQRKPMMHGVIEVIVTKTGAFLRKRKARTGESLSVTAFIIACVAKVVNESKSAQAYRWGRKRLVDSAAKLAQTVGLGTSYAWREGPAHADLMPSC